MFDSNRDQASEISLQQLSSPASIFSEETLQAGMPILIDPLKFKADSMKLFSNMPVDSMSIGVDYRLAS